MKKFFRALGRHAVIFIRGLVCKMSLNTFRFVRTILIRICYSVLYISRRKILFANLQTAYGKEKTPSEIKELARRALYNFSLDMMDLTYIVDHRQILTDNIRYEGLEHLTKALSLGKGAIILSGHFGNFLLMYFAMAQAGYKVNVIMKRARDPEMEAYVTSFRNEGGVQAIYDIPTRQCVVDCMKALRKNELLFILLDQNYGSDGRVFVDFFGKPAATATGPVVFSQRTGAPILPTFVGRDKEDMHHIIQIHPPIELIKKDNEEESMQANIQFLTTLIENEIRKRPYEWGGWLHKRWKTQKS